MKVNTTREEPRGCRMVRPQAAAGASITGNGLPHAIAEATEAAAPEAAEASAAACRIAGTPTRALEADARGRNGGVRQELAAGVILVCAANRPIGENNSSLEMARVDERTLDNNSLRILTLSYIGRVLINRVRRSAG
jgi:hypothetical protein